MATMAAFRDFLSERFELFFIYKSPRCFLPSFESTGLSVQEKKRIIDFQDDSHLGFPIGTILGIFDLQFIPMLSTNFRVNWPFGSGKEAKKKEFQEGRHGGNFGFPIGMILVIFDLQVTPMLPTKLRVYWPFCSGEEAKINIFKAILDFRSEWFKQFLIYKSPQCFLPSFQSTSCLVQEKKQKIDFKMAALAAILDSDRQDFSYFWSTSHPDAS